MKALENYTMKEIVDYYIGYLMEHDLAASKSEARQLFLNSLAYNVVRESVIEQIFFLRECDPDN